MEKSRTATSPAPYLDGFTAYIEGVTANPYHYLSASGMSWQRGWNTARMFDGMNGSNPPPMAA